MRKKILVTGDWSQSMCGMVWCGVRKDRILKVIKTIFIELTNVNIHLTVFNNFHNHFHLFKRAGISQYVLKQKQSKFSGENQKQKKSFSHYFSQNVSLLRHRTDQVLYRDRFNNMKYL